MALNFTPPGWLKNIFTGGASVLTNSITSLIQTIDAPKEQKAQLAVDIQKEVNRHLEAIEDNHSKQMTDYLSDVQNARAMQVEALKQADLFSKRFVYFLAAAVVVLTFAYDFMMLKYSIPEGNKDLCNIIAGALNTSCLVMVLSYFFGSSKGSDDKTKAMVDMAKDAVNS